MDNEWLKLSCARKMQILELKFRSKLCKETKRRYKDLDTNNKTCSTYKLLRNSYSLLLGSTNQILIEKSTRKVFMV